MDYSAWGICEYRHCALPVPPPLRFCRPPDGGRDCWHKEHAAKQKGGARGVPLTPEKKSKEHCEDCNGCGCFCCTTRTETCKRTPCTTCKGTGEKP